MKYILVADDEPMNQCIFEEMLIDDYEVHAVGNGQECLASIQQRIPDLLLLDVAMPVMDGIEVCRRLRADDRTKNLPVILVSAYASERDIEKGMMSGANLYVSKPFSIEKLRIDVALLLRGNDETIT